MAFKLFGITIPISKELKKEEEAKKSFVPPDFDDGSLNIEVTSSMGAFYGQAIDIDGTYKTDNELINRYRSMMLAPEIDTAVEEITNEAIVTSEIEQPVKLILDRLDQSDSVKKKIAEEFENILSLLEFKSKGFDYFRRWYIDARLYFHTITDETNPGKGIIELRYIDPLNIKKVRLTEKEKQDGVEIIKKIEEFYLYNKDTTETSVPTGSSPGTTALNGIKISPDSIVYITSGLYDPQRRLIYGYLHKAIRVLNQLKMMEDSMVIYRISRAPERRIFYIDVGGLPKAKAEAYMKSLINQHRSKLVYDARTGEIRDERKYLSAIEDYWFPRREGGRGTEVTTLEGAQNLSQLADVEYFLKKLCKALNVPYSRIENEQKSFQIGKSTEITRDEVKFGKFIDRLRNKFSELFFELLKKQLILKNIIKDVDWDDIKKKVHFSFLNDMYFAELKELEIKQERLNALGSIEPYVGKYYSKYWVQKHILNQSDEDIEELGMEINDEKEQEAEELANSQNINNFENSEEEEGFEGQNESQEDEETEQFSNQKFPPKKKSPFEKKKEPPKL